MTSTTSRLALLFKPNVNANFWSQTTWALMRAVIGIMMIHNGFDKLADIESFAAAYVAYIGLPFPIFFSYIAAFTEIIAAPLVAIGLFTRPAALGLFFTMCVAMYHHVKVAGLSLPYLELSAIYASAFLFLTINGAGLFSTDAIIANLLDATALSSRAKQIMRLEKAFEASDASKQAAEVG
ncbi:MAG: DoxX family protein [Cyanobacteria bacterium P01_H01_bin.119]